MAEPLWTAADIARAVGGRIEGGDFAVGGISIDTRSLEPGDLFVALAGARDGHDFVAQARARGASGVLCSRPVEGPAVRVDDDTLLALERLGVAARRRASAARRGAVTGSVGKTSVTQAVRAGLELAGPAHGSVKSYNNHIGVPLTLARMPAQTQRAVFEIGMNHAGEITPLSRMVEPHCVAITTVGPVHVENFADGEAGVARAKSEIFAGVAEGGLAILNADNVWFEFLKDGARQAGLRVATFGAAAFADARLVSYEPTPAGCLIRASLHGAATEIPMLQTGAHWGPNALAVLLMLEALEVSRSTGLAALAAFEPLAGRGAEATVALGAGAFTLIDESYNANPLSMRAAFASLGARPASGRRIAVLTDMLELGEEAGRFHRDLAEPIEAASLDLVFCAGPLMKSLWDALPSTRRGGYADTAAELAALVVRAVEPGDVVMVKGSNGSRAGQVAKALAELGPAGETD